MVAECVYGLIRIFHFVFHHSLSQSLATTKRGNSIEALSIYTMRDYTDINIVMFCYNDVYTLETYCVCSEY